MVAADTLKVNQMTFLNKISHDILKIHTIKTKCNT